MTTEDKLTENTQLDKQDSGALYLSEEGALRQACNHSNQTHCHRTQEGKQYYEKLFETIRQKYLV